MKANQSMDDLANADSRRNSIKPKPTMVLVSLLSVLAISSCKRTPPPMLFRADAQTVAVAADAAIIDNGEGIDTAADGNVLLSSPVDGNGQSLSVDNVVIKPSAQEHFTQYLAVDVDADGDRDVVVTRANNEGAARGVGFYRRNGAAFSNEPVPGTDGPTDPQCNRPRIRSVSSHSVVVTYACPTPPPTARTDVMVREHVAVMLAPTPGVRYRFAEMRTFPSTTLVETTLDAVDRDNDGRDDLVMTVSARRSTDGPRSAALAMVVMFDRATGLARDTSEPEASFARIAGTVRGTVSKRRAPDILAISDRLTRLRRVLCTESGAARVKFGNEMGIACGASPSFRSVAEAQARALLALGDLPAASASRVASTASELGVVDSDRFDSDLRKASGSVSSLDAVSGPSGGRVPARAVRASALLFDPGNLPAGVTLRGMIPSTINLLTMTGMPAPQGTPNDAPVRSPDDSLVLEGFYQSCQGISAALCPTRGDCGPRDLSPSGPPSRATLVTITDLAPTSHLLRCVQDSNAMNSYLLGETLRVVGWGQQGLVIAWRGRLLRAAPNAKEFVPVESGRGLGSGFMMASASRNGRYVVIPDADGLFVRDGNGNWRLWKQDKLKGRYRSLSDLTMSDDGSMIVGLEDSMLWLVRQASTDAGTVALPVQPGVVLSTDPTAVTPPTVEEPDAGEATTDPTASDPTDAAP